MTEYAKPYASALYELACEEGAEELFLAQIRQIAVLLKDNPEYVRLIDSYNISKSTRIDLIDQAFGSGVHPYLLSFMKILCERNAFSELEACFTQFEQTYNDAHDIVIAKVYSAVSICDEQIQRLKTALSKSIKKTVRIQLTIDPSLKGGICVDVMGKRYDNTILSRMDKMRKILM